MPRRIERVKQFATSSARLFGKRLFDVPVGSLLFQVCIAAALSFIFSEPVLAQDTRQLPAAANEALESGILATKVPDYLLAIRYFEDARKVAPDAPVIHFNLGLAESKIPGRELRAICWLSAYLAAEPNAANADAVNEQIKLLKIRNQSNLSRLIKMLEDSGRNATDVARLWAKSGDIAAAKRVASGPDVNCVRCSTEMHAGRILEEIVEIQSSASDSTGGLETAGSIEFPRYRSEAYRQVAYSQLRNGDLAGAETSIALARRAADQIKDPEDQVMELNYLAEVQIDSGNFVAARATLKAAAAVAENIDSLSTRTKIGETQFRAGDVDGARATLQKASIAAETMSTTYPDYAGYNESIICAAQSEFDIEGAVKTLKSALKATDRIQGPRKNVIFHLVQQLCRAHVALAQAKKGDFDSALKNVAEISFVPEGRDTPERLRSSYLRSIVDQMVGLGKLDLADKTAELIVDQSDKSHALTAINKARKGLPPPTVIPSPTSMAAKPPAPPWSAGEWVNYVAKLDAPQYLDLATFLRAVPAGNPQSMSQTLYDAASRIVADQNAIFSALKRRN